MIKAKNTLEGKLNVSVVKEYPELEEITVTPTLDAQELKSTKYGYSKVTIEGIPATDVTIAPSEEQQNLKGIFKEVNIKPIQVQEITTNLDFSSSDTIELTSKEGGYIKKATINKPINLKPENIKSGETICGIDGINADTSDADATSNDIIVGKTAYVNNEKIVGTLTSSSEFNVLVDTNASGSMKSSLANILVKAKDLNYSSVSGSQMLRNFIKLEEISFKAFNKSSTTFSEMFSGCIKLKKVDGITPDAGQSFQYAFRDCTSLEEAPIFNTPKATDFKFMFLNCTSLKEVPIYNTYNLASDGLLNMFNNCPNLSDDALNNIMRMCRSASKTELKTLAIVGLSEAQAERCKSLSNYQALLDAGWTTGY